MCIPGPPATKNGSSEPPPVRGILAVGGFHPAVWLATGFGVGLVFPAPGTFGTAMGVALAWGICALPGFHWQLLVVTALNLVGVPLCTAAGRALGGPADHQAIIWDEIVTMPIVFLFVPPTSWPTVLAAFAAHRLFDISKLPPAAQLERLPTGLGVMADDWAAAVYAGILMLGAVWLDQTVGWNLFSSGG